MFWYCTNCRTVIPTEADDCPVCCESLSGTDVLFCKAAHVLAGRLYVTVSMLQEWLGIGYARAGRIVNELVLAGLIGEADREKRHAVIAGGAEK